MVLVSAVLSAVGAALWTLAVPRRPGLHIASVVTVPYNVIPVSAVLPQVGTALWTLAVPRCAGLHVVSAVKVSDDVVFASAVLSPVGAALWMFATPRRHPPSFLRQRFVVKVGLCGV